MYPLEVYPPLGRPGCTPSVTPSDQQTQAHAQTHARIKVLRADASCGSHGAPRCRPGTPAAAQQPEHATDRASWRTRRPRSQQLRSQVHDRLNYPLIGPGVSAAAGSDIRGRDALHLGS